MKTAERRDEQVVRDLHQAAHLLAKTSKLLKKVEALQVDRAASRDDGHAQRVGQLSDLVVQMAEVMRTSIDRS